MESAKLHALAAFRLLFQPIARVLLRDGVAWQEFAAAAKAGYVEAATDSFGIRGRPTNVSRAAILTGLTRREVRRLRDEREHGPAESFTRMNRATRVLSGWYTDPEFSDADGGPLPLKLTGEGSSFERLCARYAADVPPTTMLKELRHVGAVGEHADGRVIALTRYYMPVATDPEQILRSGSVLADLATTVEHNLGRRDDEPARFERRATNTYMSPKSVPAFREFIEAEGQAFLERVDAWLSAHEHAEDGPRVRLGIGTYWIENEFNERTTS